MDLFEFRRRRYRHQGAGFDHLAIAFPAIPDSGEGQALALGIDRVGLLATLLLAPFDEGRHRDNAAATPEGLGECAAAGQAFGTGIEHRVLLVNLLRPMRCEPPAHLRQLSRAFLAHHGNGFRGRDVGARGQAQVDTQLRKQGLELRVIYDVEATAHCPSVAQRAASGPRRVNPPGPLQSPMQVANSLPDAPDRGTTPWQSVMHTISAGSTIA